MADTTYDAEASYKVKLARPLEFEDVKLSHRPEYTMTGERLNAIVAALGDAVISSAVKVQ